MLDPEFYNSYMAFTKQSFGVLITTMTQWWSPTTVRVSGDTSIPKQLFKRTDGSLECRFPSRLVMMANHQLYTDWLYLWWISYTNNMHGYIYIIMKESLKNIPIFGWGAQFYNFIFLKRDWEMDKKRFEEHLNVLNDAKKPMWVLIFPEGTNLAKSTREKSKEWAKKNGLVDMKHQLLPRSKGLQFCLKNLKETTEWLYDCTIGYEGIPPGQFGQDIFTLRSSMFEGRPPKSVNMHFRRFKISDIPIDSDKKFEVWLRNRWREKDYLLEHFVRYNRFPEDDNWIVKQRTMQKKGPLSAKFIETQIKSNSLEEFLSIFAPLTSVLMVLFLFYGGGNPNDMLKMIGEAVQKHEKLALVRDLTSKDAPLRLEKRVNGERMPSFNAIKEAGQTAAQAQRNLLQKYLTAVKPSAATEIDLPNRARKASNTGEKPFANQVKAKADVIVKKSQAGSTTPTARPSLGPTKPSMVSSSFVSTEPSRGPKIGSSGIPPVEAKASPAATPSKAPEPTKLATVRSAATIASKQKDLPTYKMDKATYDRMRAAHKPKPPDASAAPKAVAVKLSVERQQQAKNPNSAATAGPKKVEINPEMLKKMKAAKQAKT